MIKIGTVNGDVIEAGGVKNVTNNYYAQAEIKTEEKQDMNLPDQDDVPEVLSSERAQQLMKQLVGEGLLDEAWQPVGLSRPKAAMLADRVAGVLGIKNKWKVFEQLWHRKNLHNDYNTALNECAYFDEYRRKFESIIH